MNFINEATAINGIADAIVKGGVCLFNTIKYIYSLAERDFYSISPKDVFKAALNNLSDPDCLQSMRLRIDDYSCREMQNEDYNKTLPLMVYSLAVRIPTLKNIKVNDDQLTDDQLYRIYTSVTEKGAHNHKDVITETFLEIKYMVRKAKKLPEFTADWYKSYIFQNVPTLTEITNKNIFLLGFVDVLFAMFYPCYEQELRSKITEYVSGSEKKPENDGE